MRSGTKKFLLGTLKVLTFFIIWFLLFFLSMNVLSRLNEGYNAYDRKVMALGEKAVKDLYDFSSVYDLDSNMYDLKSITTEAIYSQLTIDNEQRTLNTYLKFKNSSVGVKIIKSTPEYVLYSLDTEVVDSSRVFIFMYNVNKDDKIDNVREAECYDFIEDVD